MPMNRQPNRIESELAARYGAAFREDTARGPGWGMFDLKGWRVWMCARGWVRAQLVNDRWCNHAHHPTLEAAFQAINPLPLPATSE